MNNSLFINRVSLPRAAPDRLKHENSTASVDLFQMKSGASEHHRDLSSAVLAKVQGETTPASAAEGEGKGGRQGGQERPSHSSYYSPVPVGGMAMPKRGSTIGDAVVQREVSQKRRRSQSI